MAYERRQDPRGCCGRPRGRGTGHGQAGGGDTDLRLAFRWGIVPANAGAEPPDDLKVAYDWITTADRPLGDLADPVVFEDVLYRVSYKLDGTPAAGDTYKRRRRALNTALEHAVVAGEFPENPLQRARRKYVGSNDVVDRRVLVNALQARQLLAAVSYVGSWDRCRGRRLWPSTRPCITRAYVPLRPLD